LKHILRYVQSSIVFPPARAWSCSDPESLFQDQNTINPASGGTFLASWRFKDNGNMKQRPPLHCKNPVIPEVRDQKPEASPSLQHQFNPGPLSARRAWPVLILPLSWKIRTNQSRLRRDVLGAFAVQFCL